jgi:WhiB family transcriptional regulator, redox-sensing transcriptional regulator
MTIEKLLPWREQAACTGRQEFFFQDHKSTAVKKAKTICAGCAVLEKCKEYALEHVEFGVWGGMTANERRRLMRARRKKDREQ